MARMCSGTECASLMKSSYGMNESSSPRIRHTVWRSGNSDAISPFNISSNGALSLVNEAAGVINASAANNQLVLSNIAIINRGLIEATGAAGLLIQGAVITNAGSGAITAGNGSHVDLQAATVDGGFLTTSGTGVIQAVDNASVLDGSDR